MTTAAPGTTTAPGTTIPPGTTASSRWAARGLPAWTLLVSIPICLSLLIAPLLDPTPGPYSVSSWLAVTAAAALFMGVVLTRYRRDAQSERAAQPLLILLAALAVCTTAGWSPAWASLFVLLAIGVGIVVVNRTGPPLILVIAAGAATVGLLSGAPANIALPNALSVLFTGLGTYAVHQLFATVVELRCTRQELARMAVAQERDRFARDLHDLLGHTLSVIVVKAEAVRRLAPLDSAAAAGHAADIESIGREALTDIRHAASGYRGAGLERELTRARPALEAAGVALALEQTAPDGPLPEEVDALLGWAVREGVTNVVRHARATRCTIGVRRTDQAVRLTIEDNGLGDTTEGNGAGTEGTGTEGTGTEGTGGTGIGLPGLAERVTALGGTVDAIPTAHGFRITVDVPYLAEHPAEVRAR